MIPPVAWHLGALVGIIAVGVYAERRLKGVEPLLSLPGWLRTLAGGVAIGGPWLLYFGGAFAPAGEYGILVAMALALVLWLSAMRLVGVGVAGRGAGAGAC